MSGDGLDTSRTHTILEAQHWFRDPNNLYHFFSEEGFQCETFDFLFNDGLLNETKFHKILLKEWFSMIKVGGYLIIRFQENGQMNVSAFIDEAKLLMIEKGEVLYHTVNGTVATFVLKKHESVLTHGDGMARWTFGILTDGAHENWIEQNIQRIRSFNIPEYEIIICGEQARRKEPYVHSLYFGEDDGVEWLTAKKNFICGAAQYENICLMHDYVILDENWFSGMKKYGNYFESLGCVQTLENGQRVGDWLTFGMESKKTKNAPFTFGLLEYKDWDEWSYLIRSLNVIKKSVWQQSPWDEDLSKMDSVEDAVFCHELKKRGYLTRFNHYASARSHYWPYGILPHYGFDPEKLGPRSGVPLRRFGWWVLRIAGALGIQKRIADPLICILKKIKIYYYIVRH